MNSINGNELVRKLFKDKSYRPTAVCIIKNDKNEFLLVRSSRNNNHWYFPQGGIHFDETIQDAFFRELYEELSIMNLELSTPEINLHYGELTIRNYDLGEFNHGKAYFFVFSNYYGPGRFYLKKDEVNKYKWADSKLTKKLFSQSMKAKADLNIEDMNKALKK